MDMEKKKNKTDKERLVASIDVQDVPAFGPEDRPPHLQSQRLLPRCSQDAVGPSQACYLGRCAQAVGHAQSHEHGQPTSPELQGQSRGYSEITQPAQPTAGSADPAPTPSFHLSWACSLRTGPCPFRAHRCHRSVRLRPGRPSLFPTVF